MAIPFDSALAALAGSAIGGLTTLAVTWITQGNQLRALLRTRDQTTRQKIYKEFIEETSKLYGDALMHSAVDTTTLIEAYALISRMRVISSPELVEKADAALRSIVDIYFLPNKTMAELRAEINGGRLDLLRDFSSAAREELSRLRYRAL
jgi:hypothetical protein